jgi:hypothetical protein
MVLHLGDWEFSNPLTAKSRHLLPGKTPRLLMLRAVAQKPPQFFPQMTFKQQGKYIMWRAVLSSEHWYVTLDAIF